MSTNPPLISVVQPPELLQLRLQLGPHHQLQDLQEAEEPRAAPQPQHLALKVQYSTVQCSTVHLALKVDVVAVPMPIIRVVFSSDLSC